MRNLDDYREPSVKRSRSTSTDTSQSHDCHDHLPGASDTPTLRSVNLFESRRFYEEVFGFEVVQLRKICRLMPSKVRIF